MKLIGISGKKGVGKDTVGSILQFFLDPNTPEEDKTDYYKWAYYHLTKVEMGKSEVYHLKFADKLKDMLCVLLDCTREQLEDRDFKEKPLGPDWVVWTHYYSDKEVFESKGDAIIAFKEYYQNNYDDVAIVQENDIERLEITPRFLMQSLGTDWGRDMINPNIWVNSTLFNLEEGKTYVITDVRFKNELESILQRGGINIRVNLPKEPFYEFDEEKKLHILSDRKDKSGSLSNYRAHAYSKECAIEDFKKLMSKEEHSSELDLNGRESMFDIVLVNDGTKEDLFQKVYEVVYPLVK